MTTIDTTPKYELPSPLKISTYTMICNLNHRVDLDILSRCIPIYEKKDPKTEMIDGTFIAISSYSASNTTDHSRGIISTKIPIKVFNNEITLLYKYWGFKQINLKIFSNGKLQMTGVIDPEFETTHISTQLINTLKALKYRIYSTPNHVTATIKHHDFIVVWNSPKQQLDYMRRNLRFHDLDYILQDGIGYDYNSVDWKLSDDVRQIFTTYIAKADAELVPLEQLRMDLLNTYEYPESVRMQLFRRLDKFKKIKKMEKKHLKYGDKKFMDIVTDRVAMYISYIKMYKTRIQQLLETDAKFVVGISSKYSDQLAEWIKGPEQVSPLELDTILSMCTDYKVSDIAIELINSDYNNRLNNNLIKLNELLNSPEYNIYNYYKPDANYAGVIAKYMYNAKYCDKTKYKEGKCYCEKSCITTDKNKCISVSISIFRPGSIIITAGKDVGQLVRVYDYLNTLFKKHYATISYIDIHDKNDHFLMNEERKIKRKENLVYIKRANIRLNEQVPTNIITPTTLNVVEPVNTKSEPTTVEPVNIKSEPKFATPANIITPIQLNETPKIDLSTLTVTVKLTSGAKKK